MMVMTAKVDLKKILIAVGIVAGVIIGAIMLLGGGDSEYGTAGLAAGSGQPGGGTQKRSAAAAAGSPGAGSDLPGTAAPDDRMAAGTGSKTAPGRAGQCRGTGWNRDTFPARRGTAEAVAAGK